MVQPTTEQMNALYGDLDKKSTQEIVELMSAEDHKVSIAVAKELNFISEAVDIIAESFRKGGRLIYVGAGTSGRLGILDASECKPTFGVSSEMVQGIIAGGYEALFTPVEDAEDNTTAGAAAMENLKVCRNDCVVGIAASGRTPFVLAALTKARGLGARTVGVTCNKGTPMEDLSDVCISVVVGPEIIAGSTRLKAGTAQKMVLNMLSTISMVKIGKVYKNVMVDMVPSNGKLVRRAIGQVQTLTGADEVAAKEALVSAGNHVKTAVLMIEGNVSAERARELLVESDDNLRTALDKLAG